MCSPPPAALQIDLLEVRYAESPAVRQLNLDLAPGDLACLVGPSGCGKTTLLRAIAGFARPSRGQITLSGEVVSSPSVWVEPEARGVGMVFQDFALFPHLRVADNILFGLTRGRLRQATADDHGRVRELLDLVGLSAHAQHFPHELSGGQQQRIALARALGPRPRLLLMDEPFSSLDQSLRGRLAKDVQAILKTTGTSALMVTHDQAEAFAIADQMGVMFDGALVQMAPPYDVYHEPCSPQVASFVGEGVLVKGMHTGYTVETALGVLPLRACCCDSRSPNPRPVWVLLRPDDILHDDDSPTTATVMAKSFRGAEFLYTLRLDNGEEVMVIVQSHHDHPIKSRIGIRSAVDHVITFPTDADGECLASGLLAA